MEQIIDKVFAVILSITIIIFVARMFIKYT